MEPPTPSRVWCALPSISATPRTSAVGRRHITDRVRLIAQARQVEAAVSLSHDAPAALCDRRLSDLLAASIERCCQMTPVWLPSGAGHDAQILAELTKSAMLFVPSIGGISHHWTENTADADIIIGAQVFVEACLRLLGE